MPPLAKRLLVVGCRGVATPSSRHPVLLPSARAAVLLAGTGCGSVAAVQRTPLRDRSVLFWRPVTHASGSMASWRWRRVVSSSSPPRPRQRHVRHEAVGVVVRASPRRKRGRAQNLAVLCARRSVLTPPSASCLPGVLHLATKRHTHRDCARRQTDALRIRSACCHGPARPSSPAARRARRPRLRAVACLLLAWSSSACLGDGRCPSAQTLNIPQAAAAPTQPYPSSSAQPPPPRAAWQICTASRCR